MSNTAKNRLEEQKKEAMKLLMSIQAKVKKEGSAELVNWGHVGSMGRVLELLKEIDVFI